MTGKTYSSYEDIFNSAGTLVAAAWGFYQWFWKPASLREWADSNLFLGDRERDNRRRYVRYQWAHCRDDHGDQYAKRDLRFRPWLRAGYDRPVLLAPSREPRYSLQFSAPMFGFSSTTSQTADAQALLSNYASGTTNTLILVRRTHRAIRSPSTTAPSPRSTTTLETSASNDRARTLAIEPRRPYS